MALRARLLCLLGQLLSVIVVSWFSLRRTKSILSILRKCTECGYVGNIPEHKACPQGFSNFQSNPTLIKHGSYCYHVSKYYCSKHRARLQCLFHISDLLKVIFNKRFGIFRVWIKT